MDCEITGYKGVNNTRELDIVDGDTDNEIEIEKSLVPNQTCTLAY